MITIASRKSRLAMWQALHVQALLKKTLKVEEVNILGLSTVGDEILDRSLSKIGGKGLFVKELESALIEGKAQLAVHSLKDVPMELPDGFVLRAVLPREDPRDAFVSNHYMSLDDLPHGAKVGTSSLRREFQIKLYRPDLKIFSLRGNLDTRLKKLDSGDYQGIILAAAGLKRLNLKERIRQFIPLDISLPAAGQGALAIETLENYDINGEFSLETLCDGKTNHEVMTERKVSAALDANCQLPLAVFCEKKTISPFFSLKAKLAFPDGENLCESEHVGDDPNILVQEVLTDLTRQGAEDVIKSLRNK